MKTYRLPILYKKKDNNLKKWEIWIENNKIYRKYGFINGKITKIEKNIIDYKKSITEVNSLWNKKIEDGYSENMNNNNRLIIKPMKAHKLDDHYKKIIYPACIQKKLDGFRCLANINNNVELYSKNMKKFIFLEHIKKEILKIKNLLNKDIYLDGELYENNIKLKNISSLVMKKYATKQNQENMKQISFYIFDLFNLKDLNLEFKDRYQLLKELFNNHNFKYLKLVDCKLVNNFKEVEDKNLEYIIDGYEGIIVRNLNGIYKLNSKSLDVLRTKEFKRNIFEIIGAKEGTGTQKGAIIWKIKFNNSNKYFWAIPIGTLENRIKVYKNFIKNNKNYLEKKVMVKYLYLNENESIIRNPIVEYIVEN